MRKEIQFTLAKSIISCIFVASLSQKGERDFLQNILPLLRWVQVDDRWKETMAADFYQAIHYVCHSKDLFLSEFFKNQFQFR